MGSFPLTVVLLALLLSLSVATTINDLLNVIGLRYKEPTEIEEGCARFFKSDPRKTGYEDTPHWTVCVKQENSRSDRPAKYSINAGLFDDVKEKSGNHTTNQISFIATGPKCWVDIYSKKSQKGEKYTIQPLQDVDLSTIPLHDSPGHSSFNDNVKSGFIRSSDAADENPESNNMPKGVVPVAVWYMFKNVHYVPVNAGCGYFYDGDPTTTGARVNGFAVCETNDQHLAHVNQHDFFDRGYDRFLDYGSIHYVVAGPEVAIGLYSEDEFKGEKTIVQPNHESAVGTKRDKVMSFILLSTKYEEKSAPPELFVKAEKFANIDWTSNDFPSRANMHLRAKL